MSQDSNLLRADVLIEALPYIQKYRGQLVVIKYGGSAMEDETAVERLLRDIVFLEAVGINPVLVHGGGKAITDKMRTAGLKAKFVNGLRVTDEKAIRIVEETLDHDINPKITGAIVHFGGKAVGISGRRVFKAQRIAAVAEGKNKGMDYGFIGDVIGVNLEEVQSAIAQESVPVISPISQDANGVVLNVNADLAAGAIAGALKASKLIYLSDVLGIMRNPAEKDSLIPSVNREEIRKLIDDEVIEGGMIPKVQSAVRAIDAGVSKVHFIDGRLAHSLLLEIFTNSGIGTEIIA